MDDLENKLAEAELAIKQMTSCYKVTNQQLKIAVEALEYMDQRFKGTHPTHGYIRSTKAAGVISAALEKIKHEC